MPTTITQIDDTERGAAILRVAGSMTARDAELLEKIALDLREKIGGSVTLDFADLHFMDSESAPIIRRLEREHNFNIEGMEYFLQKIVTEAEKQLLK